MKRNNLIAYAGAFASYLLQSLKKESSIRNIILFGSVARNDFDEHSDVDIFIDTKEDIEKECMAALDSFYESILYKKYWNLLGISNEISIKVGDLDKWDLKRSIISHGIVLFGKYKAEIEGRLFALFIIEVAGKRNEKLKVWREIYGYRQKVGKKIYLKKGILEEYAAKRLAPSIFIVPLENSLKMRQFLTSNRIKHKIIELQTDSME